MLPAAIFMDRLMWLMICGLDVPLGDGGLGSAIKDGGVEILPLLKFLVIAMPLALTIVQGGIAIAFILVSLIFTLIGQIKGLALSELKMRTRKLNKVLLFEAMARNLQSPLKPRASE